MIYVLIVSLTLSLSINVFQFLTRKKPTKTEDYDVRALLHDLTNGAGLIRVERIAPTDFFLRSPRDM